MSTSDSVTEGLVKATFDILNSGPSSFIQIIAVFSFVIIFAISVLGIISLESPWAPSVLISENGKSSSTCGAIMSSPWLFTVEIVFSTFVIFFLYFFVLLPVCSISSAAFSLSISIAAVFNSTSPTLISWSASRAWTATS
ncbi:hypothetical protein FKM82_029160 [Ascaphus truei]